LVDVTIGEHEHFEERRYVKTLLSAKAFEYLPSDAELSVLQLSGFGGMILFSTESYGAVLLDERFRGSVRQEDVRWERW